MLGDAPPCSKADFRREIKAGVDLAREWVDGEQNKELEYKRDEAAAVYFKLKQH